MLTWLRQLFCDHVYGQWHPGRDAKLGECRVRQCLNCGKTDAQVHAPPKMTRRSA